MPAKAAASKKSRNRKKTAGAKPGGSTRSKKGKSGGSGSTISNKEAARLAVAARAIRPDDDDDLFVSGGGRAAGVGFGRCGGRVLGSSLEAQLCDGLSGAGVTHSHAPRHFEVRLADEKVAAYAPQMVLRGRGREGKTVVLETSETHDAAMIEKIRAFRSQYGAEFYVVYVAPEDDIDLAPLDVYDESCTTNDLNTLISRLAD